LTAVDPTRIVAILLGASQWPAASELDSEVFLRSKRRFEKYLLDPAGLAIASAQRLDLFDRDHSTSRIYEEIGSFLRSPAAANASDLVLYFVGHGDFAGDQREYALLVRCSNPAQLETTTLKAGDLASIIRKNAPHLHQHLLIDACFAAAAQEAFYGPAVSSSAIHALREQRVEMLCSSGMVLSRAPRNEECTPFSNAILDVLMLGSEGAESGLSLKTVGSLAEYRIRDTFGDKAAIPRFFPEGADSDALRRPLFPNTVSNIQWCAVLAESAQGAAKTHPLRQLANTMRTGFGKEIFEAGGNRRLWTPRFVEAGATLASLGDLQEAIRIICRSEIAIFDLTNYEPAVMLLLGIRSVVRRGITVCVASHSPSEDGRESPFYFKDIKLLPFGTGTAKPELSIKDRIAEGLRQLQDAPIQYLDLPSFDSIRQLWPDEKYRQSLRYFDQCLVLCSYSDDYRKNAWPNISRYLGYAIQNRRANDETAPQASASADAKVIRSIDMTSPQLVSHALFDAIRRTEFCVVDLSESRPNVLFELGVRLASSDLDPVCIIESTASENQSKGNLQLSGQWRDLLKLFAVHEYSREDTSENPVDPFINILKAHLEIRERRYLDTPWGSGGRLRPGSIYTSVWQYINPEHEPVATSVSKYLAETERLYHVSDSKGRSPFIYPNTHALTTRAEKHGRECIVAALLYLQHRHGEAKLLENPLLRQEYLELAYRVAGTLLESAEESDKQFGKNIAEFAGKLRIDTPDVFDEVALTLEKVKVFRQLEQFDKAQQALAPSIIGLEGALETDQRKADLEAFEIERRNRIAAKLSNCYGIRGGLLRRSGDLKDSLSSYRRGREIEQDARYGISDSYNLVNELVLQILTERHESIGSMKTRILDAISIVSRQVAGDRHDQWWAWADLGMLNILALRLNEAEIAYRRYWATGARDTDFASSRSTLEQIRDVLPVTAKDIHDAIDTMLPKILQMKPS